MYIYIYQILTTLPQKKHNFSPQQSRDSLGKIGLMDGPGSFNLCSGKADDAAEREKKGDVTSAESSLQRGAKLGGTWAPQFSANLR